MSIGEEFPLKWRTPLFWAQEALQNPLVLLSDHAYLERKAASNALELMNRWPKPDEPGDWPDILSGIARDEARHLEQVLKHLAVRGGRLQRKHRSPYASALRALVRSGKAQRELLDRVLVSALIEARSCERFELLAEVCPDRGLARFYRALAGSESGHYRVFLELGNRVLPAREVAARWEELCAAEAVIIQQQLPGPGIHTGLHEETSLKPLQHSL